MLKGASRGRDICPRQEGALDECDHADNIHPAPLCWVVNAGGYAAQRIAQDLERQG